jgi:NADPH:quinone reductase-like Zn-dependent oxidoreductase
VLGAEFAGIVEQVGNQVTEFKVGDAVFGIRAFKTQAEYLCIQSTAAVVLKPEELSFAEAAELLIES